MAPNLTRSPARPRSSPARPAPPTPDPLPCRRPGSPPNGDDKSSPAPAPLRTGRPAPGSAPASGPRGGAGSRASGSVTACAVLWATPVCRRGSFFSQPVGHLAQPLGHVEAIDHRLAVGQQVGTGLQVRRPHVGVMEPDPQALFSRQRFQTLPAGLL